MICHPISPREGDGVIFSGMWCGKIDLSTRILPDKFRPVYRIRMLAILTMGLAAVSTGEKMKAYPEYSVKSPDRSFTIEQRSGAENPAGWETWIRPAEKRRPSRWNRIHLLE